MRSAKANKVASRIENGAFLPGVYGRRTGKQFDKQVTLDKNGMPNVDEWFASDEENEDVEQTRNQAKSAKKVAEKRKSSDKPSRKSIAPSTKQPAVPASVSLTREDRQTSEGPITITEPGQNLQNKFQKAREEEMDMDAEPTAEELDDFFDLSKSKKSNNTTTTTTAPVATTNTTTTEESDVQFQQDEDDYMPPPMDDIEPDEHVPESDKEEEVEEEEEEESARTRRSSITKSKKPYRGIRSDSPVLGSVSKKSGSRKSIAPPPAAVTESESEEEQQEEEQEQEQAQSDSEEQLEVEESIETTRKSGKRKRVEESSEEELEEEEEQAGPIMDDDDGGHAFVDDAANDVNDEQEEEEEEEEEATGSDNESESGSGSEEDARPAKKTTQKSKKSSGSRKATTTYSVPVDDLVDGSRTRRKRLPPLPYWKCERPVYIDNELVRIEKAREDLAPAKKSNNSSSSNHTNKKAKTSSNTSKKDDGKKGKSKVVDDDAGFIKKVKKMGLAYGKSLEMECMDITTHSEVKQRIVCTEEAHEYRPVRGADYKFQKLFSEGGYGASGMILIPKKGSKPSKSSGETTMYCVVLDGYVQVKIHKNAFAVKKNDSFMVPRGNHYSFTNIGDDEARLFFVQCKQVVLKVNDASESETEDEQQQQQQQQQQQTKQRPQTQQQSKKSSGSSSKQQRRRDEESDEDDGSESE